MEVQISPTERDALDALDALGWRATELERDGYDLRVSLDAAGRAGKLQVLWASDDGNRAPAFFRLDLGTPAGELQRWQCWSQEAGLMESDDPDSLANYHQTYQVATGQGWASLGVGIRPAVPSRAAWQSALGRFAAHAATLGCREGDTPEAVAEGAAYARKAARRELLAAVFLALVSIASLIGSVMLIVLGLVHVNEGSAVGGVAVFIFLFMPTAVIFGILKWQQRKRRRLEGWDRALGVLRSTGLFDQVKRRPRKEECQLAAVHFAGPEAALRSIDVSRELSFAKSSRLALRACLDLHEVEWLRSTRQACRIVPGKYAVITLTGARHLLEKLPRGPREVRSTGSVSWTFTESEAEPLIRAAAAALDSSADHPYR